MPPVTDNKGIISGYTDREDGWGAAMNQNLRNISAMVLEGFANDVTTTTGLTYGYKRGVGLGPSGLVQVPAGTIILPPNVTGYVVRTLAGVVSFQTSPTFPDKMHLATVTTNTTGITFLEDNRYTQDMTQDGTHTSRFFATTGAAATSGGVRLKNAEGVVARNATDNGNVVLLFLDSNNRVILGDAAGAVALRVPINVEFLGDLAVADEIFSARSQTVNDIAPNNSIFASAYWSAGDDNILGRLYAQLGFNPSENAANRFVRLQIGDDISLRPFAFFASRTYIGPNGPVPSFVGSEIIRLDGNTRVDGALQTTGPVTATQYNGSGAGLTANSVPIAAVNALQTNLNALIATDNSLGSGLATTNGNVSALSTRVSAVEAARPFAAVISDNVPIGRVAFDWTALGYTGTNTGGRAFNTLLVDVPAAGTVYSQAAAQDMVEAINELNRAVKQLVHDLQSRINL